MSDNKIIENRRPLKSRQAKSLQAFAAYLSRLNITPNQISVGSVFFAGLAAVCLLSVPAVSLNAQAGLMLLAALLIQCRLLCNLFDGLVAVEGGKTTNSGELFNDIPDRIADPLLLVSAGYAVSVVSWAEPLGWLAGVLAVMTAYVRTLAASIGAPVNFSGPMAKQHRMAVLTLALILTVIEKLIWQHDIVLLAGLLLIVAGSVITVIRRVVSAYRYLENHV